MAHVETVAPLLSKVATKQREEESRKRREVQFPLSAAEFNTIQDKELQQRIARFLTSDAIVQDKMLNEYGWRSRQVRALKEEYMKDVSPI
jgi:ribosomal protein S24E